MSKSTSTSRRLAPWLLALVLALPRPAAAFPGFEPGALLARLEGLLSAIWAENGCDFDPNGRCASAPSINGCNSDSNSGCAPILRENGCDADPHGSCKY